LTLSQVFVTSIGLKTDQENFMNIISIQLWKWFNFLIGTLCSSSYGLWKYFEM